MAIPISKVCAQSGDVLVIQACSESQQRQLFEAKRAELAEAEQKLIKKDAETLEAEFRFSSLHADEAE